MIYDVYAIDGNHYEVRAHKEPIMQLEADDDVEAIVKFGERCEVTEDDMVVHVDDRHNQELAEIVDNYQRCNDDGKRAIRTTAMMAVRTFPEDSNVVLFQKS